MKKLFGKIGMRTPKPHIVDIRDQIRIGGPSVGNRQEAVVVMKLTGEASIAAVGKVELRRQAGPVGVGGDADLVSMWRDGIAVVIEAGNFASESTANRVAVFDDLASTRMTPQNDRSLSNNHKLQFDDGRVRNPPVCVVELGPAVEGGLHLILPGVRRSCCAEGEEHVVLLPRRPVGGISDRWPGRSTNGEWCWGRIDSGRNRPVNKNACEGEGVGWRLSGIGAIADRESGRHNKIAGNRLVHENSAQVVIPR